MFDGTEKVLIRSFMSVMTILLILIAPLLGGALALTFRQQAQAQYKLVLSFSGAFLFTIILLHLFPTVFQQGTSAGLFVLIGFFIQIVFDGNISVRRRPDLYMHGILLAYHIMLYRIFHQ